MKHFQRLLLLTLALAMGGGLGYLLLPDFEPVQMILFSAACLVLGEIFYQVDKYISKKKSS
ncbi:MAG TPA: hypothetical protein H9671_00385 [Firmicutes bacterium]|nr:hypothetical protein [Bacillota bacterium]